MAIKLKASAIQTVSTGTPDWYRADTPALAGVTNMPSNLELGIEDIKFFVPTEKQQSVGLVCSVIIKTVVGDIRGQVFEGKKKAGTLYLNGPQSTSIDPETGITRYHDEVTFNNKVTAQVLRFVETLVDGVEESTPATPTSAPASPASAPAMDFSNVDPKALELFLKAQGATENPFA